MSPKVAAWQRRLVPFALVILAGLVVGGAAVAAIEARREVRILCGMMQPGRSLDSVLRMLETTQWSAWTREETPQGGVIRLQSHWDLGFMRCEIVLEERAVLSARLDD